MINPDTNKRDNDMGRFKTAWKAFWKILGSSDKAEAWQRLDKEEPQVETKPAAAAEKTEEQPLSADAVYTLVLLQREGRLIDFLFEDIAAYQDAQIGAAVRQIHANCRKVLENNFGIVPIRDEEEGKSVELDSSFDPRQIRLIGKPAGEPPFCGALRHHGWRATKVDFPERHAKLDASIICPAEVEVKNL